MPPRYAGYCDKCGGYFDNLGSPGYSFLRLCVGCFNKYEEEQMLTYWYIEEIGNFTPEHLELLRAKMPAERFAPECRTAPPGPSRLKPMSE